MASFELLHIPRDSTVSDKILLAGERYRIVKRRLQIHPSIAVK